MPPVIQYVFVNTGYVLLRISTPKLIFSGPLELCACIHTVCVADPLQNTSRRKSIVNLDFYLIYFLYIPCIGRKSVYGMDLHFFHFTHAHVFIYGICIQVRRTLTDDAAATHLDKFSSFWPALAPSCKPTTENDITFPLTTTTTTCTHSFYYDFQQ